MKSRTGFSLIELLVVVAIIGILAAIGTVGYNKYINHAKDAVTMANLSELAEGLKVEDAKLNTCSSTDPIVCVNELAASANMKDPYTGENLVILNDTYSAPSQAPYGYDKFGNWGPQFMSIGLVICSPDTDSKGNQFIPNAYQDPPPDPFNSLKHLALKAFLSNETILKKIDVINLHTSTYPGAGACDG